MHWVLQHDIYGERGYAEMIATLEREGIPHSLHRVVPFLGEIEPDISPAGNVIVFGSYAMRHAARRKGWVPGSFDLGSLTYRDHLEHWGAHMLNGDAVFCRFDQVLNRMPDGLDRFFVRPVADSKVFAGTVTTRAAFEEWAIGVAGLGENETISLRRDSEVMVCAEKDILREYRLWIVDGEIVTASLYKRDGRVLYAAEVEKDVLAYGRARARDWSPARAYAMDVAVLDDGALRIVETNTINAAGFYAANAARIVTALDAMTF